MQVIFIPVLHNISIVVYYITSLLFIMLLAEIVFFVVWSIGLHKWKFLLLMINSVTYRTVFITFMVHRSNRSLTDSSHLRSQFHLVLFTNFS
jgi:NADH:ubiquinone oxidoreductase subunit 3 (subunit A)